MNAKKIAHRILIVLLVFVTLLSACAPAATAQSVAVTQAMAVKETAVVAAPVEKQVVVATAPPAIAAATATAAPAAGQQQSRAPAPTLPPFKRQPGSVPTPVDNTFQNYGVNPFVDAYEDHLSTFALDVDTASYTVMRRYLQDGNLPPMDSVRVEEYVNYFDQGYPTPPDVAFGIYADGAASPFRDDGIYYLRFGIQGYQVPEWERKSANLTFVIDSSGSMDMQGRLEMVKGALQMLVDQLHPQDTVSIVTYGSDARVVLHPTSGAQKQQIKDAIAALRPDGSTNAEDGLRLGYELAMSAYRSNTTTSNRVILCSDGVANVGLTNPDDLMNTIAGYVQEGIYLTTVGVGMGNFNDVLLEQLADKGNGNYAYVDTREEANRIFVQDLTSTLQVIALNAKVQVDFNPDVVAYYRLIGYENRAVADQDFRNNAVDAGEIGAGHSATAIYAVTFFPEAQGRIATVQLRWEDPENHAVQEINGNFNTWDLEDSFQSAAPHYQLAVIVAQYAEYLRQSPWAGGISLYQLYHLAQPLLNSIPEDADVIEFVDLLGRAAQIAR